MYAGQNRVASGLLGEQSGAPFFVQGVVARHTLKKSPTVLLVGLLGGELRNSN
jgi:hypothetical protein